MNDLIKKLWCLIIHQKRHLWQGECCKCDPSVITDDACAKLAAWAMRGDPDKEDELRDLQLDPHGFVEECGDR